MRTRLSALVLIAAIIGMAGCGSSSKTESSNARSTGTQSTGTTATTSPTSAASTADSSGPPLSRAQLISHADAICKRLSADLDSENGRVRTQQDVIRLAEHRAAVEQTALAELSKLTPPASMAKDYQKLLQARQTLIEDIKKLGEDAATKNIKAEPPIYGSSATVVHQMAATAEHKGFKYCGQVG